MHKYTLAALALTSAVSAQTTTTSVLIPGFGSQPVEIFGSIVGSDATATTYSLGCADPNDDECGFPTPFLLTQGPSTAGYQVTGSFEDQSQSIEIGCKITTDHGFCTGTESISYNGTSTSNTISSSYSSGDVYFESQVITITAGAGASSANTAAATTKGGSSTATPTLTGGPSTATKTGSASSGSTGASGQSAGVSSSSGHLSTAGSTAGMAMITGSPRWALGGAAAALALAAL